MKKITSLSFFVFLVQAAFAQQPVAPAPVFVTSIEGVQEYRLSNGLQVLLVPDAANTNVVVNVVYHVGSRHEGYGETGMAHLLEHMMFKPSKHFTSIKQTIADKGASANGTTYYDRTDYYEILPAADSNLNWALDMESDRMVNSLMRKEDLQKEFTVVRNEFEADENSPNRILNERVLSTMYLWHNYGKSPIGSKEDIERVPINNLAAFYRKYYQPDNATLIVGGKFDEKKTLALIAKYFEKIPRPTRVLTQPYTVEPVQDGERYVELRRNGEVSYIGMAYHTPAYADKDYAANDAVQQILLNDPSGYFYKALVETKTATSLSGYSISTYDPGFTYFECSVPTGKSLDSAKTIFLTAADHLKDYTVTQEDLDRAKNALDKQVSDLKNSTIDFCIGLAEVIGAGDWRLFYIYRDRVDALTMADVQACLKKYYLTSNRTVGVFIPDKNPERVEVAGRPDVDALVKGYKGKVSGPASTETFEATIPNIKKRTEYGQLSNGMKYALLKKPVKGDKVYGSLILKFGDEQSLAGKTSIPALTAAMLKNGTLTRSKKQINDELDKLKSSIDFSAAQGDASAVSIQIVSDKDNFAATLDLLADILLHPSFDKNEYDKLVIDLNSELDKGRTDPQFVAFNAMTRKMAPYATGHPMYTESVDEQLTDLKTVTVDDVKKFYTDFYGVDHGYAAFVGAIDAAAISTYLEKAFGAFKSKQPYKEVEVKYFEIKGNIDAINIPDKKNAVFAGAINLPLKQGDKDYMALDMANEMLGGGAFLTNRIANRLRESEGMSYGAGSFMSYNYKYPSCSWIAYAIFNPIYKDRLDSAFRDVLNKTAQEGFKEEEFKKAISAWIQQRKIGLGTDQGLASRLTAYMSDGKDLDFYTYNEDQVKALTLDQVNAVMRKYISPDKITYLYVGDFTKK
jgi:zinc protease